MATLDTNDNVGNITGVTTLTNNLEDPLDYLTNRNANFVQYPAFFVQCPRTMSYFPEKNCRVSRFQANSLDARKSFVSKSCHLK